jgi:hypothetical protein
MTTIFHNATDAQIVDEYGDLNLQLKAIEARLKDLKSELIERGVDKAAGSKYELSISQQVSLRADQKAIREFLGETRWNDFLTPSQSSVVRVKQALPEIPLYHIADDSKMVA